MGQQNRYCTRCHKTQRFKVEGSLYTCSGCGVRVQPQPSSPEGRILWGDPFQFRTRFV